VACCGESDREAYTYADQRPIGKLLSDIGFVQYRLNAIDASAAICEALKHHVETRMDYRGAMLPHFAEVQSFKVVATENIVSVSNHWW
jgi:hypothetical protein